MAGTRLYPPSLGVQAVMSSEEQPGVAVSAALVKTALF